MMDRQIGRQLLGGTTLLFLAATILVAQEEPRLRDRPERDLRERDRSDRSDEDDSSARRREYEWQLDANQSAPRLAPPASDPDYGWFLGVTVSYRDIGAECTTVVRRSPAQQAGLEAGDLIVSVNGYQVGRVNGRLFPLERELDLRADRRGRVQLLVQDHRSGRLAKVDVRLEDAERRRDPIERPDQLLIGTVSANRRSRLPDNAVLVVSLVDVTGRLSSLNPIAQRTFSDLGPLPIPFELPYNPARIRANHDYSMRAYVTVHGVKVLSTRGVYPVLSGRPQGRIRLELEPAR